MENMIHSEVQLSHHPERCMCQWEMQADCDTPAVCSVQCNDNRKSL